MCVEIEITYNSDNGSDVQYVLDTFAERSDVKSYLLNWRTLMWEASFTAPDKKSAKKFIDKIKRSRSKHLQNIGLKVQTTVEEEL